MLDPEKVMLQNEVSRLRLENDILRSQNKINDIVDEQLDDLGLRFIAAKKAENKRRPMRCVFLDWLRRNEG